MSEKSVGAAEPVFGQDAVVERSGRSALLRFGQFFQWASLATMLAAGVALGMLYRVALLDQLQRSAESNNVALAQLMSNGLKGHQLDTERLAATIAGATEGLRVLKIKLYAPDGRTLFSTNRAEIGHMVESDDRFGEAQSGRVSSELEEGAAVGEHSEEPELSGRNFVETYVPLRAAGPESPVEVIFELYYDVGAEVAGAARIQWLVIALTLVVMGLAYAVLIGLVRPADQAMRRQYQANLRLAAAIEQTNDIVEITDNRARLQYVNPAFERLTGWSAAEVLGRTPGSLLRPESVDPTFYDSIWEAISRGESWRGEYPTRCRDGRTLNTEVSVSPVRSPTGEIIHHVAVKRDVTDARRATEALRKLSRAVEQSSSMVLVTDRHGVIEYVNPRFSAITGFAAEDAVGRTPRLLKSGHTPRETYEEMWKALLAGDSWQGEIINRKRDGSLFWEYQSVSPIRDENGRITHFVSVKEDISDRKRQEARIEHLALFDSLTELPNRASFHDRLQSCLSVCATGGRGALLYVDLDEFKDVNDTLGHPVGDAVLKMVAGRLTGCLGGANFAARIGGDEFAVLMPFINSADDAAVLAGRLIAALGWPYPLEEGEAVIGASIGIALFPDDGTTAADLLRNADLALYRCKHEGSNIHHFYAAEMDAELLERKHLGQDLRVAIDHGQLDLHFQPIIELATRRITAVEALLRWNHPTRGQIRPDVFIPIAESTRLIVPIGEWVLRRACRQVRAWQDQGLNAVPVAVNLSLVQFRHMDLAGLVADVLAETRLAPDMLHLEVTESVAMENSGDVLQALAALRRMGVQVSLDDFGTGFSSLSHLRRMPIDRLKIDRSFLSELDDGPSGPVTEAVVRLGQSLGMHITVEGVETPGQLAYLDRLGGTEAQGFFFARPQPASVVAEILRVGVVPVMAP